jgi:hypothetical protein
MMDWIKRIWVFCVSGALIFTPIGAVHAGALQERLDQFPNWRSPPTLQVAKGDLHYPDWMAGDWQVTSTLVDLVAPLAPDFITPGFAANQKTLQQPVTFAVRFGPGVVQSEPTPSSFPVATVRTITPGIVADRAYNGMNLATALLGKDALQSIKADPRSPNRQVAVFQNGQRLLTQVSHRWVEMPSPHHFVSSELYQQTFRSNTQIYLNRVENTIAYQRIVSAPPLIEANQVTAIYLSPQDPDYWKARDRPVALYRYRMRFEPVPLSVSPAR